MLEISCANCSATNPAGSKFCQGCGKSLAASVVPAVSTFGNGGCAQLRPSESSGQQILRRLRDGPWRGNAVNSSAAPTEVKPAGVACPDCGLVGPAGSKFCERCGKRLTPAAPAAVQAMPEPSATVASVAEPSSSDTATDSALSSAATE